jgi:hypothetical protein
MKVVSGSLDVLETVGKKTFDVCKKYLSKSNEIIIFVYR